MVGANSVPGGFGVAEAMTALILLAAFISLITVVVVENIKLHLDSQ